MKNILCLVFLLLFTGGCNVNVEKPYRFDVEYPIEFEEIPYPEILGETIQLLKYDSLLFVNDYHGDSLIHQFNLRTGNIERKLFGKGEGPNEVIPPLEIQLTDTFLYVLSRPLYRLGHVGWSSLKEESIMLEKDFQLPPLSDCFVSLGNSRFIFSGFFDKRYAYLDINRGGELKEFGDYPAYWSDEKDLSPRVRAFFHQCIFAKHPTKNRFVSCSGYVMEVFSFDPQGNTLPELVFRKMLGKYSYDFTEGEFVTAKVRQGSDPGMRELACTEKYIYIVISSKSDKTKRNIMVIGWDGQPVRLLKSDKMIKSFLIDEAAGKGYCIIQDPEDKLVCFDLPDE